MAVGGTVNSDPRAWVNNCAPGQPCDGDAALSLSRQVQRMRQERQELLPAEAS